MKNNGVQLQKPCFREIALLFNWWVSILGKKDGRIAPVEKTTKKTSYPLVLYGYFVRYDARLWQWWEKQATRIHIQANKLQQRVERLEEEIHKNSQNILLTEQTTYDVEQGQPQDAIRVRRSNETSSLRTNIQAAEIERADLLIELTDIKETLRTGELFTDTCVAEAHAKIIQKIHIYTRAYNFASNIELEIEDFDCETDARTRYFKYNETVIKQIEDFLNERSFAPKTKTEEVV